MSHFGHARGPEMLQERSDKCVKNTSLGLTPIRDIPLVFTSIPNLCARYKYDMCNLEKSSTLEIFILILLFNKVSNVKIGEKMRYKLLWSTLNTHTIYYCVTNAVNTIFH